MEKLFSIKDLSYRMSSLSIFLANKKNLNVILDSTCPTLELAQDALMGASTASQPPSVNNAMLVPRWLMAIASVWLGPIQQKLVASRATTTAVTVIRLNVRVANPFFT
jgi:hypothetical protein